MDWFIEESRRRNIYVLLDMHGAFGSQNGRDHSGDIRVPDIGNFFGNEENIALTVWLWEEIARRYKGDPIIAGFDLLNETSANGMVQWLVYDQLYRAIRAIDPDRIIHVQAIWHAYNLPRPELFGWTNIVYQYHFYYWGGGVDAHRRDPVRQERFTQERMREIQGMDFGVPTFIGEFSFFDVVESWERGLAIYEAEGWSWTTWTMQVVDAGEGSSWGLYTSMRGPAQVNVSNFTVSLIESYWHRDSYNWVRNNRFADVQQPFFQRNAPLAVLYGTEAHRWSLTLEGGGEGAFHGTEATLFDSKPEQFTTEMTAVYEDGRRVVLYAGTREGYVFAGWTSADMTIFNADREMTAVVIPSRDVTVTANWRQGE